MYIFTEFQRVSQRINIIHANNPVLVTCQVNCSMNLSGCRLKPHWFVRERSDCCSGHSLIDDKTETVVQTLNKYDNYSLDEISCERYDDHTTTSFNYTLTSIGNYDEVFISCGLENLNLEKEEDITSPWVVIRKCKYAYPCKIVKFLSY